MFWQFANHIFDTENAKCFYPILDMIGNIGLIIAGNILVFSSDIAIIDEVAFNIFDLQILNLQIERMLKPIMSIIVILGLVAMGLFRIINNSILNSKALQKNFYRVFEDIKTKFSVRESFKLITKSKYIGHIVLLILCYGLLINILEGPWKAKVRDLYPSIVHHGRTSKWNFYNLYNSVKTKFY